MENTNILATLRAIAETKANEYAAAYNGRYDTRITELELNALKKATNEAVTNFNAALEKETYKRWDEEGDPVKTALRTFIIPHAIGVTFKTDKVSGMMTVNWKELTDYRISLLNIEAVLGKDRFANEKWFEKVSALAWILAEHIAKRVSPKSIFTYEATEAAKAFSFKDGVDLFSVDGVTAALQEVFDAILFLPSKDDPKKNVIRATDAAWTVINRSMTSHGSKRGSVAIHGIGYMSALVAEMMNVILTNGDFLAVCE